VKEGILEVLVDNAMVIDNIEDRADDGDRVVLGKLAFNARLVKLDLKGRPRRRGGHRKRYKRCCGGQNR